MKNITIFWNSVGVKLQTEKLSISKSFGLSRNVLRAKLVSEV